MANCPCGSIMEYEQCCGRFHQAQAQAPTAAALMRSRYSAFAVHDEAYLLRTWHPSTRPPTVEFGEELRWVRLDITGGTGGALFDGAGTVSFTAHYVESGRPGVMREDSDFVRENGEWLYVGPL